MSATRRNPLNSFLATSSRGLFLVLIIVPFPTPLLSASRNMSLDSRLSANTSNPVIVPTFQG
jgi:hypothetical protein